MGYRYNHCKPCCDCAGSTTTISGRVSIQCSFTGQAGNTVTATGPETVSTTTNASGDYTLVLSKTGTYTVTATGPCGTQSQMVNKPTCGLPTTGINFTFPGYTLTATFSINCYDPLQSSKPEFRFYLSGSTPGPFFGGTSLTYSNCVQPGTYVLEIKDNAIFVGESHNITVGCGNTSVTIPTTHKKITLTGNVIGCAGYGFAGATAELSGGASGSAVTNGDGDFTIENVEMNCAGTLTISSEHIVPVIFNNLFTNPFMNTNFSNINLTTPIAPYQCWSCCNKPLLLYVEDEQGVHPVTPGAPGETDCITVTKPAAAMAVDEGFFGLNCKPEPVVIEDRTIAYKYTVQCSYPGVETWTVFRVTPFCNIQPPVKPGPLVASPVASSCVGDAPRAVGDTGYYGEGGSQVSPARTCGPLSLAFSGTFADLGDFTLKSD